MLGSRGLKIFSPLICAPLPPGGKNTIKMPLFVKKCKKNVKKVDSAPKNGPNLMYDSLLEAYGHVVWFSEKNNFRPPIFAPPRG